MPDKDQKSEDDLAQEANKEEAKEALRRWVRHLQTQPLIPIEQPKQPKEASDQFQVDIQKLDFFTLIQARRSVRAFKSTPIEPVKLELILRAANRAPSAGNLQAYEIYVATNQEKRQALAKAALGQEYVAKAPVVLIFCAHPALSQQRYMQRGVELYSLQDTTIACTYAMLACSALGLASVWIGAFDENIVYQIIGSPHGLRPIAMLPIGYPAEEPHLRPRRSLDNITHRLE